MVIIQRNAQYESEKDIYLPLLIDLLISNNFSSMTFFAQRIFYELLVVNVYNSQLIFFTDFFGIIKKNK